MSSLAGALFVDVYTEARNPLSSASWSSPSFRRSAASHSGLALAQVSLCAALKVALEQLERRAAWPVSSFCCCWSWIASSVPIRACWVAGRAPTFAIAASRAVPVLARQRLQAVHAPGAGGPDDRAPRAAVEGGLQVLVRLDHVLLEGGQRLDRRDARRQVLVGRGGLAGLERIQHVHGGAGFAACAGCFATKTCLTATAACSTLEAA